MASDQEDGLRFAVDLWDGFDAVAQRTEDGLQACKEMLVYMKKRAELEADYGKRLQKLSVASQPTTRTDGSNVFGGTSAIAWQAMLDASQEQARAHVLVAKQLEETVIAAVASFVKDMESARKKLVSDGQRLLKDKREQEETLAKAHNNYIKASEACDETARALARATAEAKTKDTPKLQTKLEKCEATRAAAEEDYKLKVTDTNAAADRFMAVAMPKVMDDLQHLETVRIHLLKTNLKKAVRVLEGPPPATAKALLTLKAFVTSIDNDADLRVFIEDARSSALPPPPFEFVPYGGDGSSAAALAAASGNGGPNGAAAASGVKPQTAVFACSLDEVMAKEPPGPDGARPIVPRVLTTLTAGILAMDGAQSEGLFRLSGEAMRVKELRAQIDRGNYDLSGVRSVHVLTGTLKLWFREMTDPLVPVEFYDACLEAAAEPAATLAILAKLPPANLAVIRFLMQFLRGLATDEIVALTKMTADNLSMVFAPSLMRCPYDVPQVIFENAERERLFTLAVFHAMAS